VDGSAKTEDEEKFRVSPENAEGKAWDEKTAEWGLNLERVDEDRSPENPI